MKDKIVVIGGSAGGVEAVKELIAALPANLNAAVFIVIHFPPSSVSYLADILNRRGALPAHLAIDGEAIEPGKIYVSVPDFHLLIEPGKVRLTREARENHNRPSIDVLFRNAAKSYGSNVIGVVLSGLLNDGTAGLIDIKKQGGITMVQDPATASFGDMPLSAIRHVPGVDYILSPKEIARQLVTLVNAEPETPPQQMQEELPHLPLSITSRKEIKMPSSPSLTNKEFEDEIVAENTDAQQAGERDGLPSIYSCPDCGGVLWQMNDDSFVRFRCHVGHAFSGESLLLQQAEVLESALWYALRTMIDKGKLARQLARTSRERGHETSAVQFDEQAQAAEYYADVMRQVVGQNINGQLTAASHAVTAQ